MNESDGFLKNSFDVSSWPVSKSKSRGPSRGYPWDSRNASPKDYVGCFTNVSGKYTDVLLRNIYVCVTEQNRMYSSCYLRAYYDCISLKFCKMWHEIVVRFVIMDIELFISSVISCNLCMILSIYVCGWLWEKKGSCIFYGPGRLNLELGYGWVLCSSDGSCPSPCDVIWIVDFCSARWVFWINHLFVIPFWNGANQRFLRRFSVIDWTRLVWTT